MEKTEKILCIFYYRKGESLDYPDEDRDLFIAIDIDSATMEMRENDSDPFGFPFLPTIVRGDLFWVETTMKPGSIFTKIIEADLSLYSTILNNSKILTNLESCSGRYPEKPKIEDSIRERYSYHRDKKIGKILD
jgi:hypothetical protein